MKKNVFILFICLVVNVFGLQAQTKLSGETVDKSNNPLSGVQVNFNNGQIQTVSDSDGKFTLTYPDTLQKRIIRFHSFGYKTKTLALNKNQQTMKVILLDSVYNLGSAKVSASRNGRFSDYSAQTMQMSTFDIVTNPVALADIIANMRILPGVQANDNDGRLIIQGGNAEESQVYINDLIVSNPYSASAKNAGARSRFNSDLFEGIVLQSGGFNAEFGQALSGVVNLNTKEREQMEAKTTISVSSIYAGVTHIDKKPSYAYRANLDYVNMALSKRLNENQYRWKKDYQQIAADFFLTKEFSPNTKMTAQFNGSYAGGMYAYENIDNIPLESDMKQTYLYAQMNFYHTFSNALSLSVAGNVVIDKLSVTDIQTKSDKLTSQNTWNHNKITLQYKYRKLINRLGTEFIYNPYTETYSLVQDYISKPNSRLFSVYNDLKLFLTNNLTANVGLRGEYSDYLQKFNVAPRIYVAYRLNAKNIFSVSVGDYFQLPDMNYLKQSDAIDFASVTKGAVSYSYVKQKSKFQVDAYYKKYKDAVTYSQGKYSAEAFANAGSGYGYGVDLFWKNNIGQLEYWLTYSYNNTKKQYDYFSEKIAPPYVAPHSFNITLKYWIKSLRSMIASNYSISSGTPYYNEAFPYAKSGDTPFRNRWDISWSYLPTNWIVVHFGCQNVLGYKNIYGYEYSAINAGVKRAITANDKRFLFLGVFVTFSKSKTVNELKNL
ncbi:MAG: TonB-dependent receptor [Prevotellaceae bacterium]|nr:TonB-dependent receptor [Prevotellaceae bacterium]